MGSAGEYVQCVQQQLTKLGYDTGGTSGKFGAGTTRAAQSYLAKSGAALPKLTERNALTWCRELGNRHRNAKAFQPSAKPPKIYVTSDPSGEKAKLLLKSYERAQRFVLGKYKLKLASQVDIVGGDTHQDVINQLIKAREARRDPNRGLREGLKQRCNDPERFGGFEIRNQIVICWPQSVNAKSAWKREMKEVSDTIMAHEFVHHVQRELSNDKVERLTRGLRQDPMGPAWLIEGTAQIVELKMAVRNKDMVLNKSSRMQHVYKDLNLPLRRLQHPRDMDRDGAYELSYLAVIALQERVKGKNLFTFWEYTGRGADWETAFHKSYGIGLREFEALFDGKLRSDGSALRQFTWGAALKS